MTTHDTKEDTILVLDFGSQYTQLIARRIRELGVYSIIESSDVDGDHLSAQQLQHLQRLQQSHRLKGVVLSGSPESVGDGDSHPSQPSPSQASSQPAPSLAPSQTPPSQIPEFVFEWKLPVLAICYGMQALAAREGGRVVSSMSKEYGSTRISIDTSSALFSKIDSTSLNVWMSHGDTVKDLPPSYRSIAVTEGGVLAGIQSMTQPVYALQFHPELSHTESGQRIIDNFLSEICKCKKTWKTDTFLEEKLQEIRSSVPHANVLLALSGGVDSAVLALLLHKAIGNRLHCFFVDNGLLRKHEADEVMRYFASHMNIQVTKIDAQDAFLTALKGVSDPEKKRKIIGRVFIETFEKEAKKIPNLLFLAQGTIYPDRIESAQSKSKKAKTIKSHHNVGGLPDTLSLSLLEPLKDLFKDEVRKLGAKLGLAHEMLHRHPFPGPGLAVRILGEISKEKIGIVQEADAIFMEELHRADLYHAVNQAFAVYIPVKTVGVVGDRRCYADIIGLRAVKTVDFMSAEWAKLPHDFLALVSTRIINEVAGVSRVVYDISEKPPATIEWE